MARAIIVGAGPNGLTAAARLAAEGWEVEVYERAPYIGGAAASSTDIFNNSIVDLGAAGHPFGIVSPAFNALKLEDHGLEWLSAGYEMAHPFEGETAVLLSRSLTATAEELGADAQAWEKLHAPIVENIDEHIANLLAPILRWPRYPARLAQFGIPSVASASILGKTFVSTERARALLAGSAVHAIASPTQPFTGAFGLLFGALGMRGGWPVAKGGTQSIIDSLSSVIHAYGGKIFTDCNVSDLRELPRAEATILNLTPRQVLQLRGTSLPHHTRWILSRWKYGTAAFKVDFLLSEPVPWSDLRVGRAGTVHVGGTVAEISRAEKSAASGRMPDKPFVLVGQQFVADPSRGLVLWSYAHVPHGYIERYPGEVREAIIRQIERFAPGFREVIVDTHETSPEGLESWNPNIIGGDIAGGAMTGAQTVFRPKISPKPHRLRSGLYLASSATSPGAGVHGVAGWWAAEEALTDLRNIVTKLKR